MTTIICTLGIFLTFGALFPPLGVALAVSILATVRNFKANVSRLIVSATERHNSKVLEQIQAECSSEKSLTMLRNSVWMLVTISCWFYTLFLFDTLGDSVGFNKAYWVLIVMPLMPLVMYIMYRVACKYLSNSPQQVVVEQQRLKIEMIAVESKSGGIESAVGAVEGEVVRNVLIVDVP